MGKLNDLKQAINGLLTEKTSTEEATKIGAVSSIIADLEKEEEELIKSHEDLRKKYIEAIKFTGFNGKPTPAVDENTKPKTFEECCLEAQKK